MAVTLCPVFFIAINSGKFYIFTIEQTFAIIILHLALGKGVTGMEENMQAGILIDGPVNIPVQMMTLIDRDGKMTPLWFRLEMENHAVRMCRIMQVVSRDEKRYVGVREKQFVCKISMGEIYKTLDMRYNIETQRWRIFQFL